MYNHIIFDIKTKNLDLDNVESVFWQIVNLLNLTVLKKEKHIFENWGFTIFWIIAESHLSAHYRIEDDYLAVDIYSCRNLEEFEKRICEIIGNLGEYHHLTKLYRNLD